MQSAGMAVPVRPLALMVAVLGGFLYHLLFEAKSQYLMIYLPMMAPLGAWGLGMAPRRRQGSSRAMMRIFSTPMSVWAVQSERMAALASAVMSEDATITVSAPFCSSTAQEE